MARVLINNDVSSLYPNLVRIYGYSSRNQSDKDSYVKILQMRMDAKHKKLSQEFLDSLNVTNDDIKDGLKLIINSYTGTLRADFNNLNDPLQGVSICFTGQCLLMQLGYDLMQIPTVHLSRFNTDAVEVSVEEEYVDEVYRVVHEWEKLTGLEMEDDKIVKLIARDINNYCGIYKVKDGYEVHYKGSDLTHGNHKFKWDKEKKIFEYSFKDSLKSNSLSIVSESLLKFLLFNIPIRETINNCNDIFRFQLISHLGSTYEKCVQESENGDILLQRHNRIYCGNIPSGNIVKVKPDGRRDSLANCPPNPIVDNGNKCTIDDINKEWYIEFAQEKANGFLGIPRLTNLKKEELLERAKNLGLEIDKKIKKDELIEMIKNKERNEVRNMAEPTKQELKEKLDKAIEQNQRLVERIKESESGKEMKFTDERLNDNITLQSSLYKKINELRNYIRNYKFVYDEELPSNLGGGEYYNIKQFYNALQEGCLKCNLDFSHDVVEVISFDKELVKPSGKSPIHVATIKTKATLTDIDTGISKEYFTIAQGSDNIDKAISGANTLAFRQWFMKNFSPKDIGDEEVSEETIKSEEPKTPVYIPETKKEEIKKEVVQQVQVEKSDDEDIKEIVNNIMKVRELTGDNNYGYPILKLLTSGVDIPSADILEIDLKVKNKLEKVTNNG